jgi:hypothetical protein
MLFLPFLKIKKGLAFQRASGEVNQPRKAGRQKGWHPNVYCETRSSLFIIHFANLSICKFQIQRITK